MSLKRPTSVTTATLTAWLGAAELTLVAMSPDAATATAASTPTEPAILRDSLHLPSLDLVDYRPS